MGGEVSFLGTRVVRPCFDFVFYFAHHYVTVSFAGLGFLSFYLAGKLHLFDERGHTGKAWIALAPLTGALLTAISRTMDYRRKHPRRSRLL